MASQAVGVAQGALNSAIGYLKEQEQFGHRIAEFQGIEFIIADIDVLRARITTRTWTDMTTIVPA